MLFAGRELSPKSKKKSRPRVLFICGSLNQTTQLHSVAGELVECEPRFSAYYGDGTIDFLRRLGLIEMSIAGSKRRSWCLEYLRDHGLPVDDHGREGGYDLVVTCSDLLVPPNTRESRMVVVQEGILDPPGILSRAWKRLPLLPRWIAGTALTGQSGEFDRFCVASEGYREFFIGEGIDPDKLTVTGIPNFDDCRRYLVNDFPHRGFVLVCTSDTRETFKRDDRRALVSRAKEAARGRRIVFKLHPNENHERAEAELHELAPDALVYSSGSAEEMIANADVVFTQWSSTAFVALALGKEVHSNFSIDELRRLMPVQNGGRAAKNVARVCRDVLNTSEPRPFEPLGIPLRSPVGAVCA